MKTKLFFESKTVWLNVITLAIAVLGVVSGSQLISDHPQVVAIIGAAQAALNIALRFVTDTSIVLTRGK